MKDELPVPFVVYVAIKYGKAIDVGMTMGEMRRAYPAKDGYVVRRYDLRGD